MAGEGVLYHLRAAALVLVACGFLLGTIAHAQSADGAAALNAEVVRLYQAGKYAEATEIAKRALAIGEKALGPEHPSVGTSLNNLAELYRAQSRFAEAEPLHRRSLAIQEKVLGPEHPSVGTALNNLAELYRDQGRYADAEPLIRRSLTIREKVLGPEHPSVGTSLNNLATLYQTQGRFAEAEPLFRRSLAVHETALGPEHPNVATALNNLALLYRDQGRYDDAEPLYRRSLTIREKALGPNHPEVGTALNNLASLYQDQGRYSDAEPLYKQGLAVHEKALGPDHPGVGTTLNNLAELYRMQGRFAEAEPLYRRSFAVGEKALGPAHPGVGMSLNNLAEMYRTQGRFAEAEPLYRRSLAIREKALGLGHLDVGQSLNNLALLYQNQGQYAEAEQLFQRTIAIFEKALGPYHPDVGTALNNLAELHREQGRDADAEPLIRRSLAIREKVLGPDHPYVGTGFNNLALLYRKQGRTADAEPLYRRSVAIFEKALGFEHSEVAAALNNLALLYLDQGRFAEAELLFRRSLAIREKTLGAEHPAVGTSLNNLAMLFYVQSDWANAADYWRRSTSIVQRRAERGLTERREGAYGGEAQRVAWQFRGLVKASYRLATQGPTLASEMFEMAQWAQGSQAAASLAQMAARSATGSPELSLLVRERQDLVSEWHGKDKLLIAAKSEEPAKRKADAEKALSERLSTIDTRLAAIDARLAKDFPDYAAMASPASVSVTEVQAQLRADEALVLFFDTEGSFKPLPEESFIWVVTKTEVRWVRSDLGTEVLDREVAALRCGLDAMAWDGSEKCAKGLGVLPGNAPRSNEPLPFDHGRAHKLYSALFGQVQDLIKGKQLLIVPSGPLTKLPFQVLVTEPPSTADHHAASWLARKHAITVLPAVTSLKALRRVGKPSAAPKPMLGIGNPLLDGPADGRYAALARLAREKQRCPETHWQRITSLVGLRAPASRIETRGGLASIADIKVQTPLPETADELCAVAQDVKAGAGDILLGVKATEREVKRLSAAGELAKYRMVHFATHGFLSGQLDGTNEPGLILTPPDIATKEDDGYLSASEIAALKLDADWVILSACNTAAGAAANAEALSGLARAFIYAQARALLVSHWEVYSDATVKLITGALREITRDAKVGRAEALRRSMLALIDKGEPREAHPAYWAPFVVVGEGAAKR